MVNFKSIRKVIPYLEPSGNYNGMPNHILIPPVIPYLEPFGNYNIIVRCQILSHSHYIMVLVIVKLLFCQ